ncbi:unnamed protein product, partial [Polarella glacialis]
MVDGRRKSPAPFFTTRVGASVVSHGPGDPRHARSPEQLRSDPRGRFKDSYASAAKHFQQWLPNTPSSPSGGRRGVKEFDDFSAGHTELGLQLELQEARSEIQQLRNALRASASALQHASSLLPPELGFSIEADTQLIQDLTNQVRDKDEQLL